MLSRRRQRENESILIKTPCESRGETSCMPYQGRGRLVIYIRFTGTSAVLATWAIARGSAREQRASREVLSLPIFTSHRDHLDEVSGP